MALSGNMFFNVYLTLSKSMPNFLQVIDALEDTFLGKIRYVEDLPSVFYYQQPIDVNVSVLRLKKK